MAEDKKKEHSLAEAFQELEGIAEEFEKGEVDLEEGIPKFKRGLELARHLKSRLTEIENEIEEIKDNFKDVSEQATQSEEKEDLSEIEPSDEEKPNDVPF